MENQKLKTIIVDDEHTACMQLQEHLSGFATLEILFTANSVDEAIPLIIQHQPDLIFLDVEMPGKKGFDLVEELRHLEIYPNIVFVTAHQEYAIRAIRCAAFDYLLKPVDLQELNYVVNHALSHKLNHNLPKKIDHLLAQLNKSKRIRFNTRSGFILVNPYDIIYVEADWNYSTIVYINQTKETVCLNIGKVENMLPSNEFFRINRSTIINLNYLKKTEIKSRICFLDFNGIEKTFKTPSDRIKALMTALG